MKRDSLKELIKVRDQLGNMLEGSVNMRPPKSADALIEEIVLKQAQLIRNLQELSDYVLNIARGQLKQPAPTWRYMIGGSLMELDAQLLHLNWQIKQIAKGDYSQKIEFSDEMNQSFEQIIQKLRAQQ